MSKKRLILGLVITVLGLCLAAVVVFRVFFVWPVRMPTGNMMNTILPGDHLIMHKMFGAPARGDIVVFQHVGITEYHLARVIGLPGETIQVRGKLVTIDGRVLDEERVLVESPHADFDPLKEISVEGSGPYRVYYTQHSLTDEDDMPAPAGEEEFGTTTPFKIPADSYFILGDNRDNSYDSRFRGAVPGNRIWGKPSIIYYSVKLPDQGEVRSERMFKKVQ